MKKDLNSSPPKWANCFLEWYCAPELIDEIQGDLLEAFHWRLEKYPSNKAKWLFVWEVIRFFRFSSFSKNKFSTLFSAQIMFKNYFKIASRNLWKRKGFAFINIFGLSLGIACSLLVFLFVKDEVTYDRFQKNFDQLYRLTESSVWKGEVYKSGSSSIIMGEAIQEEIPEIQEIIRIKNGGANFRIGEEIFARRFLYADQSFLNELSFPLLSGNAETALSSSNSIILDQEMAEIYFGGQNPIGKEIEIELGEGFEVFTVTAVAKNVPTNSSIQFSILLPFQKYKEIVPAKRLTEWFDLHLNTLFLMQPNVDVAAIEKKINQVHEKNFTGKLEATLQLQPFSDIHLNEEFETGNGLTGGSSPTLSYLLLGIGIIILLIASINFANLSIGMSFPRAKEIGIRKVIGAHKKQVITQFLGEALLTSSISLLFAFVLIYFALPVFSELMQKELPIHLVWQANFIFAGFVVVGFTTLMAGFYPALVVSRFKPIKAFTGKEKLGGKNILSKGLIVFQFMMGTLLIIGMLTIRQQMSFIVTQDLGFDYKNMVQIFASRENVEKLTKQFQDKLKDRPNILNVSANMGGLGHTDFPSDEFDLTTYHQRVEANFLKTFGFELKEGRDFDPNRITDAENAVIVNEAFVKAAQLKNPVGTKIPFDYASEEDKEIIGVVKDFHFLSLKDQIKPMIFHLHPEVKLYAIYIKLADDNISQSLALVEETWKDLVGAKPFNYSFLEEDIVAEYQDEQRFQKIIEYSSIFALIISALGLFGLASLHIQQRSKEVGIRKVLGASLFQIISKLSAQFFALILIAFIIAVPLAIYFSQDWLESFAYRIQLGWQIPLIASLIVFALTALSLSYQSIRLAISNPVDSLREE